MNRQLVAKYCNNNPPWADKAVKQNEARIKRAFGAKALPVIQNGEVYTELGCGHYGCVYETNLDGKVLKITSDPSEVELIKFILTHVKDVSEQEGLVKYYKLLDLRTEHRGRKVYAALREEAYDIGELQPSWGGRITQYDQYREGRRLIIAFLWFARHVREMYVRHGNKPGFNSKVSSAFNRWDVGISNIELEIGNSKYRINDDILQEWKIPSWLKSTDRAAFALVGCKNIAEMMSQSPEVYAIGTTLLWFMCHGKVLADVHLQNIGKVIREENQIEPILAITDPGHAVQTIVVDSYVCD